MSNQINSQIVVHPSNDAMDGSLKHVYGEF